MSLSFLRSVIADSETTDLKAGSGLLEFSILDMESQRIQEWIFSPNAVVVESPTRQDLAKIATSREDAYHLRRFNDWRTLLQQQASSEAGRQLNWEESVAWFEHRNPMLFESIKNQVFPQIEGRIDSPQELARRAAEMGVDPKNFVQRVNVDVEEWLRPGGELEKAIEGKTVWIANSPFECLGGDTLLQTPDGDLVSLQEAPHIILGTSPKNSPARTTEWVKTKSPINKGLKESYEVHPVYGVPVRASAGHLWFTQRGWVETKDLKESDWLLTSITEITPPENPLISDEELSLLGWFVAEGRRLTLKNMDFNVTVAEAEYQASLPIPYEGYGWRTSNGKDWRLTHGVRRRPNLATQLVRWAGLDSLYSYEKFIPREVLRSSNRQLGLFLASMWCGDGHIAEDGFIYTTTSKKLAHQLILALQRMGVWSRLDRVEDNRAPQYHDIYRVSVPLEVGRRFLSVVPLFGRKRREAIRVLDCWDERIRHRSGRRVPLELTPDWMERWKEFADLLISNRPAGRYPYKRLLREYSGHNTDGVYDGNSDSWSLESLERLSWVFRLELPQGLMWTPIRSINPIGLIEVWDIETNTGEFLAAGLVVHNSKVVGTRIGALTDEGKEVGVKRLMETSSPNNPNPFYVTGQAVNQSRVEAQLTGDWTQVWKAYVAHPPKAGETAVRDIQDLTRAIVSYGRKLGMLDTPDEYFGAGIEVQSQLLASVEQDPVTRAKMLASPQHHRSSADVRIHEEYVLRRSNDMLVALQALDEGDPETIMKMGAGEGSPLEMIRNYFGRMNALSHDMVKANLIQRLSRARIDIATEGYSVQTAGVEKVIHPMQDTPSGGTEAVPRTIPRKVELSSMDMVVQHLSAEERYRGFGVDPVEVWGQMKAKLGDQPTLQQINAYVEENAKQPLKERISHVVSNPTNGPDLRHAAGRNRAPWTHKAVQGMNALGGIGGRQAMIAAAAVAAGLVVGGMVLGTAHSSQRNNTPGVLQQDYETWLAHQEGMQTRGVNAQRRSEYSDFGSPYRGPFTSSMVLTDQDLLQEREKWLRERYGIQHFDENVGLFGVFGPFRRLNLKGRGGYGFISDPSITAANAGEYGLKGRLVELDLSKGGWKMTAQDADTVTVNRTGVRGFLSSLMGMNRGYTFRMAGIDAPETAHGERSWHAPQPHAEASKAAFSAMLAGTSDIRLVFDPMQTTYGRMMGAVIADGKNLNYELVRTGQAAYLPYGNSRDSMIDYNRLKSMESLTATAHTGMWSQPWAMAYFDTMKAAGDRVTFNTFTNKRKIVESGTRMSTISLMEHAQENGMYGAADAMAAAEIGTKMKAEKFKADYGNPMVAGPVARPHAAYMADMMNDQSVFMSTHGTGHGQNKFSRRGGYGKYDRMMALDSVQTTNSVWSKKGYAAYDAYGTRQESQRQRREMMAQRQRDVNQTIFASGIGHHLM